MLTELSNLEKYEERAKKLVNICKDIIRRYNEIREEEFLDEFEEIDDFIDNYGSKQTFTYKKDGKRTQQQLPTGKELQKMPAKDISKIDEKNNREQRRKDEEIKLSNNIDGLINSVNKIIEIFFRENTISSQQQRTKQEVATVNNLPATISQKRSFGEFISEILDRIKSFFFRKPDVVVDVPYREVDDKEEDNTNQKFRNGLLIDKKEQKLPDKRAKSNFTFLTEKQCFGEEQLDILKKRGTKAAITDFSVLLGGWLYSEHVENDSSLEGRTGIYWTKLDDGYGDARGVSFNGYGLCYDVSTHFIGARPALSFSSIGSIPTNGESGKRARDGILEVEYGYYPQKVASKDMQEELERAYKSGSISKTRNSYTTNSVAYNDYATSFQPQIHQEYEYNGKRYVRVEANLDYVIDFTLSNGEQYRNGDAVWVEVLPVKWLVDEKAKIMITEKLIFAGVQFNNTRNYQTKDFDKTNIKWFMDTHFSRDLLQSRSRDDRVA